MSAGALVIFKTLLLGVKSLLPDSLLRLWADLSFSLVVGHENEIPHRMGFSRELFTAWQP